MPKRILQYLLILTLFTPLVLDLGCYQPYITGKYFWLATFILLSLPIVFYFLGRDKNIWQSHLFRLVFLFFIGLIVINIFSIDSLRTWWGDWQRMDGLWYFVLWLPFFVGLILALRHKKDWIKFLRIQQLVMAAIVLWAWGQKFAWPFLADEQADRVFSLIGNANFLAHYLILGFWLSLVLYYFDYKYKFGHLSLALFILPAIFVTGSRAALLTMGITLLVWIIYLLIKIWSKSKIKNICILVLILIAGLVTLIGAEDRYKYFTFNDTTINTRVIAGSAGISGWQDRPLLGWGKNNFQIPFNKYLDLKIYEGSGTRMWFDKAHNQYIDYLVEGGMAGLILYLIFLAVPFFYLKKIKENYNQKISLLITLGLVSNLIFLFFNFDTIASLLLYFIYLAFIYFLTHQSKNMVPKIKYHYFLPVFGTILMIICLFYLIWQPLVANRQLKNIYSGYQNNIPVSQIVELAMSIDKLAPQYRQDLSLVLATIVERSTWSLEDKALGLQIVLFYSQQASQQHILDAKIHYLVANTYLHLGSTMGSLYDLEQAMVYYQNIIPQLTNKDRPDMIYNLVQTYYELSLLDPENKSDYQNQALDLLNNNYQIFSNIKEAGEKLKILQDALEF